MRIEKEQEDTTQSIPVFYPSPIKTNKQKQKPLLFFPILELTCLKITKLVSTLGLCYLRH